MYKIEKIFDYGNSKELLSTAKKEKEYIENDLKLDPESNENKDLLDKINSEIEAICNADKTLVFSDINFEERSIYELNSLKLALENGIDSVDEAILKHPDNLKSHIEIKNPKLMELFDGVTEFKEHNGSCETRKNMYRLCGYTFKYDDKTHYVGSFNDGYSGGCGFSEGFDMFKGYSYFPEDESLYPFDEISDKYGYERGGKKSLLRTENDNHVKEILEFLNKTCSTPLTRIMFVLLYELTDWGW